MFKVGDYVIVVDAHRNLPLGSRHLITHVGLDMLGLDGAKISEWFSHRFRKADPITVKEIVDLIEIS